MKRHPGIRLSARTCLVATGVPSVAAVAGVVLAAVVALAVAVALAMAASLVAVGAGACTSVSIEEKRSEAEEWGPNPGVVDDPTAFLAEHAAAVGSGSLKVPIYRESDLIFASDGCVTLGVDAGFRLPYSFRPDSFEHLQTIFPSSAIRRTWEGTSVYVMYDTDAGGRLYVFFSEKNHYLFVDGFPLLMKKKLSHEKFAGLAPGDGLAKVESIDPVTKVYREVFDRLGDVAVNKQISLGMQPTSIHLLSDGILKIEYRRDITLGYVITGLVYSPDFALEGLDGRTCYCIDEADYVK